MGGGAAAPGALYVGESARLTNAATGEGIYQAMRCGVIAAETLPASSWPTSERRRGSDYTRPAAARLLPGFVMGHAFRAAVRLGVLDGVAWRTHATASPHGSVGLGSALTASSVRGMAERISKRSR